MKKDNRGFSLVELIAALAILSIASAAIFQFMVTASRSYQKQTVDVKLQYEAQLAVNQLQELLVDAVKGVSYSVNGGGNKILSDTEIPSVMAGSINSKQLWVYNKERYYCVEWVAGDQKLYYSEYRLDGGAWKPVTQKVLMAEYVAELSADLSHMEENGSLCLDVLFDNGKQYRVTQTVYLRNQVAVNAALNELYD